jgi:hypothetical protein
MTETPVEISLATRFRKDIKELRKQYRHLQ